MRKFVQLLPLVLTLLIAGCSVTPDRNPPPAASEEPARVTGMPSGIRFWGDSPFPDQWLDQVVEDYTKQLLERGQLELSSANYLVLSGGAEDGAFGAGILVGWTDSGTRPEFDYVTGISTGALIAPFAFLGSEWDWVLREIYTRYSTKDIAILRSVFAIPFSDSAADTTPLKNLMKQYVTREVLDEIAAEYKRGRYLVVGTTNLDAQRPMLWDMGAIASIKTPEALELFHQVLLASAAVPAVFPPVYINVDVSGERFDEMHVDGGAVTQLVVFPAGVDLQRFEQSQGIQRDRSLYVIRNARIDPEWEQVDPNLVLIGNRSIETMIKSQGLNDLYKIWVMTQRHGINYNLASIERDFEGESIESFDIAYMSKLFDHAYNKALNGYPWRDHPPIDLLID